MYSDSVRQFSQDTVPEENMQVCIPLPSFSSPLSWSPRYHHNPSTLFPTCMRTPCQSTVTRACACSLCSSDARARLPSAALVTPCRTSAHTHTQTTSHHPATQLWAAVYEHERAHPDSIILPFAWHPAPADQEHAIPLLDELRRMAHVRLSGLLEFSSRLDVCFKRGWLKFVCTCCVYVLRLGLVCCEKGRR